MSIEILMPALSPTMTEGTLSLWHKQEGDKIKAGDILAEIETDKATMEVEAVDEGILGKIIIQGGTESVAVNSVIAVLLEDGEDSDILKNYSAISAPVVVENTLLKKLEHVTQNVENTKTQPREQTRIFASPLAKRIATDKNLDLTSIKGTGPHGRIVKVDVESGISGCNVAKFKQYAAGRIAEEYRVVSLSAMRKVIAKRLLEAKATIPHFYLDIECNITALLKTRAEINKAFEEQGADIKLSVNDFILKACSLALRDVPEANSSWADNTILMYNNIDISVAVAIDGGLITPIIKNADQKSIAEISNEMKDLVKRAKENSLSLEEFQGGGFSISNLGMYGIKNFKAIINPPQACILAVGASARKPVVDGNEIIIADIIELSLSCDHRVVDGAVGAKFLGALRKYLENPGMIFAIMMMDIK